MDRDTVRTVLLITGLLVIAGVYLWGVYLDKIMDFLFRRGDFDEVEFDADQDDGSDDQRWIVEDHRQDLVATALFQAAEGGDDESAERGEAGQGHGGAAPTAAPKGKRVEAAARGESDRFR